MLEEGLLSGIVVVVGPVVFVSSPAAVEPVLDLPGKSLGSGVFLVLPSCTLNQHEGIDSQKGDTTKTPKRASPVQQAAG